MTEDELIEALNAYEAALAFVVEARRQHGGYFDEDYITGYDLAEGTVTIEYAEFEHGYYDGSGSVTVGKTSVPLSFVLADDAERKSVISDRKREEARVEALRVATIRAQQEAQERAVLAALKKKYGDAS